MRIKRSLLPLGLVALLVFTLASCGRDDSPSDRSFGGGDEEPSVVTGEEVQPVFSGEADEIILYIRPDYFDPELFALFQEEFEVEITEDNFADSQEMLARLRGLRNQESYALIVPSNFTAATLIEEGLLAELDQSNLPNLSNLTPRFRNLPYDPGNRYCVPYQWGTVGLGFNSAVVEAPSSWSVVFNPAPSSPYFGRVSMLDDARESIGAALMYLGYSPNSTDASQLEEAKQLLINAKGGVADYDSDTYDNLLAAGETLIAHGSNRDFLIVQEQIEDLSYTIPREGGVIWSDNLCIPATTSPEKKAAAERFINFLLRPDIGVQLSAYNSLASPVEVSGEPVGEMLRANPFVFPPEDAVDRLHFIQPVGEFESVYQSVWEEVKSAPAP